MKKLFLTTIIFALIASTGITSAYARNDDPGKPDDILEVQYQRYAEITQPKEDAKRHGEVAFRAYLMDDDYDDVQWAVRKDTCAANTNTVIGNVDGHNDPFTWKQKSDYKYKFVAKSDTSSWEAGMYCFVLNPVEDPGESDIRLTREFYIAAAKVTTRGTIIEHMELIELPAARPQEPIGNPPMLDFLRVDLNGKVWDLGTAGYMGKMRFKLYNVGDDTFDGGRFKSTEITDMNFYVGDDPSCSYAMNMTMTGTYNGMPGYTAIYRAGDSVSMPAKSLGGDTVRLELYKDGLGKVYDTHNPGEFSDESHCVGTARTGLDKGNLMIEMY